MFAITGCAIRIALIPPHAKPAMNMAMMPRQAATGAVFWVVGGPCLPLVLGVGVFIVCVKIVADVCSDTGHGALLPLTESLLQRDCPRKRVGLANDSA